MESQNNQDKNRVYDNYLNRNRARNSMRTIQQQNRVAGPSASSTGDENFDSNKFPVAMAYVPWQTWGEIYELPEALRAGTIFPELNLEFTGRCSQQ